MYKTYEVRVEFLDKNDLNSCIRDEVKEVNSLRECLLYIGDQAIARSDFYQARISTLYKKEELTEAYESVFKKNVPEYGAKMPVVILQAEWNYEPEEENTIGVGTGYSWPFDEYEDALKLIEEKSKEKGFISGKIIEIFMNSDSYHGLMKELNQLQEEKDE